MIDVVELKLLEFTTVDFQMTEFVGMSMNIVRLSDSPISLET